MKANETDSEFEDMLQMAVADKVDHELRSILEDKQNTQEYIATPSHKERMEKLFAGEKAERRMRLVLNYYSRAAAVILFILIVGFSVLAAVPGVRNPVLSYIYERLDENILHDEKPASIIELRPAYVPEEYSLAEASATEYKLFLKYVDEKDNTIEVALFSNKNHRIGAENGGPQIYSDEGAVGIYPVSGLEDVQKMGKRKIVWYADDYIGTISSTVSVEEMRKMYLSIG